MNDVFRDPDGDQIEYVIAGNDHMNLDVRENTELFIAPDPDYNGENLVIGVMARDGFGGNAGTPIALNIAPLNDPPEAFNLESPEDGFTVNDPRYSFEWETAAQNRWELDEVRYSLNFYAEGDREFSIPSNGSRYRNLNVSLVLDGLQLTADDMPVTIQWDVDAFDDSSSVGSEQTWGFVLDVLDVEQNDGTIPTEFILYQSFPNPFNSTTTIRYGVPTSSELNMLVYNSSGVVVDRLFSGSAVPGIHTVHWNADKLPPGLYFVSLNTLENSLTQKVTLVK